MSDELADVFFRSDIEINRLLIQARLIKKSITRLSNHMAARALPVSELERLADQIEHKRELLRLARIQIKRRKELLNRLIAVYRTTGAPDWESGRPGRRLATQSEEVCRLGNYLRTFTAEKISNNLAGQSIADLDKIITELDRRLAILGPMPSDAAQRKVLLRQKVKMISDRDALLSQAPSSNVDLLLRLINSFRPLRTGTYTPETWPENRPPPGLVPLRRAFQVRRQLPDEDFIPQTLRELFVDGHVSNNDKANFVTGVVSVL
jgi:hypothetical protein